MERMATLGFGAKKIATAFAVVRRLVCLVFLAFLVWDTAPSHASRLAYETYKTVSHGTVGFQPPCSPDLSPSDFFWWNELKVQLVQHPAPANPAGLHF